MSRARAVEILWVRRRAEHDIVIEIDEPPGEPRDAMNVALDGWRAERGEVRRVRKNLLVIDHEESRVTEIEPVRNLVCRDNVNAPHPGRKAEQRTEAVTQLLVVLIAIVGTDADIFIRGRWGRGRG